MLSAGLALGGTAVASASGHTVLAHVPNATVMNLAKARAAAAPHIKQGKIAGVVPPVGRKVKNAPAAGCTEPNCNLLYNGGSVQHSPHVYLLFWGPAWGTDSGQEATASYMEGFYRGLGAQPQDDWSTTTDQYSDSTGHPSFSGSVYEGAFQDTSTPPTGVDQSQLAAEADAFTSAHGITDTTDAQIVIATQSGTCPQDFYASICGGTGNYCAWHSSSNEPYTNLPYILDSGTGCGEDFINSNGTYDGFTMVGGHEYAETITDPFPVSGWYDGNDSVSGGEVADKCAWAGENWGGSDPDGNVTLSTGSFAMQSLWSNSANACVMSTAQSADTVLVTSPGNRSSVAGGKYTLAVTGSSSGGYALTWSATGLPSGMAISSSTGVISGKFSTAKTYSVKVTAKDTAGASGSASFTWTVKADTGSAIKGYGSLCLDDHGDFELVSNPVDIYTCNGTGAQKWSFSGGELKMFGLCVADTGGAGTDVYITNCKAASTETWTHPSNEEYVLKSNGLCLTDPGSSKTAGTLQQLAACKDTANQKWSGT